MNKQLAIVLLIAAALIGGVLYWALYEEAPRPEAEEPAREAPSALSYLGNTLSEERDGKKVWELTANVIEIDAKTKNAVLKEIQGTFYQDNGRFVTIEAPEALYDVKTKDISITGNATARSNDGAELTANKLFWAGDAQVFSGEGGVRLQRGDTVIVGDKIESDAGFRKFKVSGNARIIQGGTE